MWLVEERSAHARLPVVELPDRPRAGARLRRSAVPVRGPRSRRARRWTASSARSSRKGSRRGRTIAPGWFRKRLPAHLEPAATGAHTRRACSACTSASCLGIYQARTFELLGGRPPCGSISPKPPLRIVAGEIDAQENPLANTVTYGVHKFHRFHTISNHFYISRPIFLHRPAFDAWPADLKEAMQRGGKGGGRLPARSARPGGGGPRARSSMRRAATLAELTADGSRRVRGRGEASARRGARHLWARDVRVRRVGKARTCFDMAWLGAKRSRVVCRAGRTAAAR